MSGLHRAPVTKSIALCSGGLSLMAWIKHISPQAVALSPANILGDLQLWRILTGQLIVKSPAEMIVFAYLLYKFSHVERLMGSNKFSMFSILCTLTSSSLSLGLLLATTGMVSLARPGPYSLIFALFVYYYKSVPKVRPSQVSIAGINFSEKSMTYLVGALLMFNKGSESVIPSVAGLVFGTMFFADVFRMRQWRWPRRLHKWCQTNILPFIDYSSGHGVQARPERRRSSSRLRSMLERRTASSSGANEGTPLHRTEIPFPENQPFPNERFGHQQPTGQLSHTSTEDSTPQVPLSTPDPEKVDRLMQMGFERDAIEQALAATDNNEEAAVHRLLQ